MIEGELPQAPTRSVFSKHAKRIIALLAAFAGIGIYVFARNDRFRDNPEEVALQLSGTHEGAIEPPADPSLLIPDDSPVARVEEWVEDPDLGAFAVLAVLKPDQVSIGSILRVQRKGEFLCRLRVQELEEKMAIASPIGTPPKPAPGPEDLLTLD